MKQSKVLLVGVGGYGNVYVEFFKNNIIPKEEAIISGVVDPMATMSKNYDYLKKLQVPICNTMEEYFRQYSADLTIVCAPTPLHKVYSLYAMEQGSHVLCEKPLVSTLQELFPLIKKQEETSKSLGVGFQWSFSNTILSLKKDILEGIYGRPIRMKTLISWPRPDEYYMKSNWRGRIYDEEGHYILDSIVTNATAHYLHNIFFVLGEHLNQARYTKSIEVELYRAKTIETFDTCFIKGKFDESCEFLYMASHVTNRNCYPRFTYEFEKGIVVFNETQEDNIVYGKLNDGSQKVYGNPFTQQEEAQKLLAMLKGGEPTCSIETIRPHLVVCNAVFERGKVNQLVQKDFEMRDNLRYTLCNYIFEDMMKCYEKFKLPYENKCQWSQKGTVINLDNYNALNGINLM